MIPLPFIDGAIRPDHPTFAMEFTLQELPLVLTARGGEVAEPKSINLAHVKQALVVTAIEEYQLPVTWNSVVQEPVSKRAVSRDEKTFLRSLRHGKTQAGLLSYRD